MKKLLFTLIIIHFSLVIAQAQSGWFWQNPLPQGNNITDMKVFNSGTGYFANFDNIVKTTDGGRTLKLLYTGFGSYISSVFFMDENTVYATIDSTKLIKTTDGGNNWKLLSNVQLSFYFNPMPQMIFFSSGIGFILSSNSNIYPYNTKLLGTIDGGKTWNTKIQYTNIRYFQMNFPDQYTGYITGSEYSNNYGYKVYMYKTTNSGNNWISLNVDSTVKINVNSLYFINPLIGLMDGSNDITPSMYRTTNGGLNWTHVANFASKLNYSSGNFYLASNNYFYRSSDTGTTWNNIGSVSNYYIYLGNMEFTDLFTGYASGSSGIIYKTTNTGINWLSTGAVSESYNLLWDVKFIDQNTGCAAGDGGSVFITTNGGNNWKFTRFVNNYAFGPVSISPDKKIYIVEGYTGKIFRSSNAGNSWDTLYSNFYAINRLQFFNALTAYGVCKYLAFIKTTDGGYSWTHTNAFPYGQNWAMDFIDEQTGYAGGNNLYKTTNGGNSWDSLKLGYTFVPSDIQFLNYNTGYAAGGGGSSSAIIIKTTNGGANWQKSEFPYGYINDLHFVNERTGYFSQNYFYKTTNSGENWFQTNSCSAGGIMAMDFTDSLTGYAVGYNGTIIKTTTGGLFLPPPVIPIEFSLSQNYPNPFNPLTKIKISIPLGFDKKISLVLYDILGRKVAVLVNEVMESGVHEILWNGTNYASGVYFYQLIAGDYNLTKKMVLLK